MIYIIHRALVFLKNHLNYLEDNAFLRSIIDFYFSKKLLFFFATYNGENTRPEGENIIKIYKKSF